MRIILVIVFSFIGSHLLIAQSQVEQALVDADSLFQAQKFTESFKLYDHLLHTEKKSSPSMLLRMAYIKEGLGDYSLALYYLNLYYLQTSDKSALRKMEELAEKKNLEGYTFNDFEFIKSVFFKYFDYIVYSLMAISLLLMAVIYRYKIKMEFRPVVPAILNVLVLALLFYTLNYGREYHKAIIIKSNTYIMDGPSAGAEVVDIVTKGHRLPTYKKTDVWTETEWNGKKAFIKTDKIKDISLL
ncbi:hypothetical protein [Fulvivirga ligni]|uniref:hypothetical protein n=1 Tax=Fulvivirga ligni TaxID=2904246 RepID=UPI001F32D3DA|nr:hypothetical protein [Fulvivirga ligni]UII21405.1 hypothetical protein LVD16_26615 [Fulvivirga ligni]